MLCKRHVKGKFTAEGLCKASWVAVCRAQNYAMMLVNMQTQRYDIQRHETQRYQKERVLPQADIARSFARCRWHTHMHS